MAATARVAGVSLSLALAQRRIMRKGRLIGCAPTAVPISHPWQMSLHCIDQPVQLSRNPHPTTSMSEHSDFRAL